MFSSNLLVPPPIAPGLPALPRLLRPAPRATPGEGLFSLGGSLFRLFAFETRRRGEARTCPPRTVGCTALEVGNDLAGPGRVGDREAVEVSLHAPARPDTGESAKEKVVFCNRRGETRVFQADRTNRSAALCACGNATGAAAATLAHCLGRGRMVHDLHVPDGRLAMRSRTARAGDDGWRVEQSWVGIRFQAQNTWMRDRRVAVCTGSFNDYLVVLLSGMEELERFELPEVLELWAEARKFSGFDNPLQSRLVALAPREGRPPFARFYTCGRTHPGAPLTGMATLAMAAGEVDWLAALLAGGAVEHRRGSDSLPGIEAAGQGYEIHFPTIDVVLQAV